MASGKKSMRFGERTMMAVIPTVLAWASGCGLQPTIDAGIDQTVVEGETVTLTAVNGSTATLSNFLWEQLEGPLVMISGAETTQATFTAPSVNEPAELVFQVTAYSSLGTLSIPVIPDSFDLSADLNVPASDTVTITVEPIALPDVNAGNDLAANAGETVVLGEDTEINLDGAASTFTWIQTSGPEVELLDADTANPSFIVPAVSEATTLVFLLTVETRDGVSASDTLSVTIDPGALPTALITASATVYEGQAVTFSGVASTDPEGGSLTYAWEQIDDNFTITLDDPTSEIVSFTASTVTEDTALTLRLTVTSQRGGSATALHTITIQPYPLPIASAGPDQVVTESDTVTLDGSGSLDPAGGKLTMIWSSTSSLTFSSTTIEKPVFSAPSVTSNLAYTITLTVTNEQGDTASDTVGITVLNAP
ncbi:MAG: hypothetical protein IIB58_01470 [Planctomycetes bacterium]|nr:hypothetical protein [Planctomycetota bacterium]